MHILAIVIGDDVDKQLLPFMYFDGADNQGAKFEWYKVGGHWERGLFKLTAPRRQSYFRRMLGRRPESEVNQARMREVDLKDLKEKVPFAYVFNGRWRDKGRAEQKVSDEAWREEYQTVIDSLPPDALIRAVDIHL